MGRMKQCGQKGIRTALVFIPMIQTVITLLEQDGSERMGFIMILSLLVLGCSGAFCIAFGEKMLERLLLSSGLGTMVMVVALSATALLVNGQTILITVLFCMEFLLSILYAIGRRFWLFL